MRAARFNQIVFMDDFVRSMDNGLPSNTPNRRFLRRSITPSAVRLGLRCLDVAAATDSGDIDVATLMKFLGLTPGSQGWAAACASDLRPAAAAGLLPALSPDTLVVGWGLTPAQMRWIDGEGATFIDVEIAPIRFAPHLMLCLRTNDPAVEATLQGWRINEELFWNEASVLQGYYARRGASDIVHSRLSVGLFCGQTAIDLALVSNGAIAQPIDALDKVRELAASVDLLLFKPHPYEPGLGPLKALASQIPNASWTRENIYALLCADNLKFVSGLTTGTLREAAYFLKNPVACVTADRNDPSCLPPSCGDWIYSRGAALSFDGLSRICGLPAAELTEGARAPSDALDRVFGFRWGFDSQDLGLHTLPVLMPDRVQDFSPDKEAHAWLGFGWSLPEPEGLWTLGEHASVVIPLADGFADGGHDFILSIDGDPFVSPLPGKPGITIRVNGRSHTLGQDGNNTFDLPIRLADLKDAKVLTIEFDIADPQRPIDHGISGDGRPLGFFLKRLAVRQDMRAALQPAEADTWRQRISAASPFKNRLRRLAGLGVAAAIAFSVGLWQGNAVVDVVRPAEAGQKLAVGPWQLLERKLVTDVGGIRDDIHTLLLRHHV